MIHSNELQQLDEPSLYKELAYANMDCATELTKQMTHKCGAIPQTIHHAKVIMSLIYHGVELFLKYAIAKKGEKVPGNHYIRELKQKYEDLYTEEVFRFEVPFITNYLGFSEEELAEKLNEEKKKKNEGEQIYRYHADKTEQPWQIVLGVEPEEVLTLCSGLRKSFNRIEELIAQQQHRADRD